MALLQIDDLAVLQLAPFTAEVMAGDWIMLQGPSGCGKSMLLRALADMEPHQGEARLEGTAMSEMSAPQWRRQVQLLPAESAWWEETVSEHMQFDGEGLASESGLLAAMETLGLKPQLLQSEVASLSSGEKQRLAFLRAMQCAPKVVLLDEPTSNLDPDSSHQLEQWLQHYIKQQPVAVIWVTHDAQQYRRLGNRYWRFEGAGIEETDV